MSGTTAIVFWERPEGFVSSYTVEYVLSSEGFTSKNVKRISTFGKRDYRTETSLHIDKLRPCSTYLLKVAAWDRAGKICEFSPETSFSTKKGECLKLMSCNQFRCISRIGVEVIVMSGHNQPVTHDLAFAETTV